MPLVGSNSLIIDTHDMKCQQRAKLCAPLFPLDGLPSIPSERIISTTHYSSSYIEHSLIEVDLDTHPP